MSVAVERILEEVSALPQEEREQLRHLLNVNGRQVKKKKEPLGKFVKPIPVPDSRPAMRWLSEHGHEYEEQWVALDGDRLIAHNTDYWTVSKAAKDSGVYLPLITFIERPPQRPFVRV